MSDVSSQTANSRQSWGRKHESFHTQRRATISWLPNMLGSLTGRLVSGRFAEFLIMLSFSFYSFKTSCILPLIHSPLQTVSWNVIIYLVLSAAENRTPSNTGSLALIWFCCEMGTLDCCVVPKHPPAGYLLLTNKKVHLDMMWSGVPSLMQDNQTFIIGALWCC